ncbi:hypothetical protein ACEZCY_14510 [Streptacidiphilus sp. N1-12]|uniref:Uncharacterized protein n=2 Tax=Streptacidiphilus alkalitolerans TaxID=3342712 RepID=A0ABV6WEG9_9ACTN
MTPLTALLVSLATGTALTVLDRYLRRARRAHALAALSGYGKPAPGGAPAPPQALYVLDLSGHELDQLLDAVNRADDDPDPNAW